MSCFSPSAATLCCSQWHFPGFQAFSQSGLRWGARVNLSAGNCSPGSFQVMGTAPPLAGWMCSYSGHAALGAASSLCQLLQPPLQWGSPDSAASPSLDTNGQKQKRTEQCPANKLKSKLLSWVVSLLQVQLVPSPFSLSSLFSFFRGWYNAPGKALFMTLHTEKKFFCCINSSIDRTDCFVFLIQSVL